MPQPHHYRGQYHDSAILASPQNCSLRFQSGFRALSERFQSGFRALLGSAPTTAQCCFRLVDAFPCAISSVFVTSEQNRGGLLTRGICPLITGARYGASSSSFDALLSCLYRYSPAPRSAASLRHLLLVSRTLAASFTL